MTAVAAVDDDVAAAAEASVPAVTEPEAQRGEVAGSVWWLQQALMEVYLMWKLLHHHC